MEYLVSPHMHRHFRSCYELIYVAVIKHLTLTNLGIFLSFSLFRFLWFLCFVKDFRLVIPLRKHFKLLCNPLNASTEPKVFLSVKNDPKVGTHSEFRSLGKEVNLAQVSSIFWFLYFLNSFLMITLWKTGPKNFSVRNTESLHAHIKKNWVDRNIACPTIKRLVGMIAISK